MAKKETPKKETEEKSKPSSKPKSEPKKSTPKPVSPEYTWNLMQNLYSKVKEGAQKEETFVRKSQSDKENAAKHFTKEVDDYATVKGGLVDVIKDIINKNKDNPDALIQQGVAFIKDIYRQYHNKFGEGLDEHLVEILQTAPEKIWKILVENTNKNQVQKYIDNGKGNQDLAQVHLGYLERKGTLQKYQESKGQDPEARETINQEFDNEHKPAYKDNNEEYKVLRNLAEALSAPIIGYSERTGKVRDALYEGVKTDMKYAVDTAGKEDTQKIIQAGLEGKLDREN